MTDPVATRPHETGQHLELDYMTLDAGADELVHLCIREDGLLRDVEDMFEHAGDFLRPRAPTRVLSDASAFTAVTWADRWRLAQGLRHISQYIARHAVIGTPPELFFTAQVIVRGSGQTNLRFFDDESAALDWLREPLPAAS